MRVISSKTVAMDDENKKLYGLFGYVVITVGSISNVPAKTVGKRVRELYEKDPKQELMLCTITNSNYKTLSKEHNDESLGYFIQYQLLLERRNYFDAGLRMVATLETYPEQEKMLKAITGYSYQELVDMIPKYESDYDKILNFKYSYDSAYEEPLIIA